MKPPPATVKADLELARRVQRSMIPGRVVKDGIDITTRYVAAGWLGGDYATVFRQRKGRFFVCVSDVTGHGIAAALLSSRVNSFVLNHVAEAENPCAVVDSLNRFLCKHFEGLAMFVSFFAAVVDLNEMRLSYSGCGHPPALLLSSGARRCVRLESRNTLLGIFPDLTRSCSNDSVPLYPGDRLLITTDGIIEARDDHGTVFGLERLERLLVEVQHETSDRIADRVVASATDFCRGPAPDDLLVMAVRLTQEAR